MKKLLLVAIFLCLGSLAHADSCTPTQMSACASMCNLLGGDGTITSCSAETHSFCIDHPTKPGWIQCGHYKILMACACGYNTGPDPAPHPHFTEYTTDSTMHEFQCAGGVEHDEDGYAYCLAE